MPMTPKDSSLHAPSDDAYWTKDFENYAERTRASWSLFRYLWVCLEQKLKSLKAEREKRKRKPREFPGNDLF